MSKPLAIGLGIGATVLVVLLLTVLNKRWWARRIMLRWNMAGSTGDLAANDELIKHTTLADFVALWRDGRDGWTRKGTATTTETSSSDMAEAKVRPNRGTALVN